MKTKNILEQKLTNALAPNYLEVIDESRNHNVPLNAETHFKVTLVSTQFEGKRPVARHQSVYGCLHEELAGNVHALALHLYTPEEWQERNGSPTSPPCLGGSKSDA